MTPRAPLWRREQGAALLIALLTVMLLAGVAAGLIVVSTTETMIAAAQRHVLETSYAAESAFDAAVRELDLLSDWNAALASPPANVQASFIDGQSSPTAPDGRVLNLIALTAQRQADANAASPGLGADTPSWRLFAHAGFSALLPPSHPAPAAYLVVWIADDGFDGDGDPARDANATIQIFAEAHGAARSRKALHGIVFRGGDGVIRVLTRQQAY